MNTDNKDRFDQSADYKSRRMFNLAAVFLILSFLLFLCQLINFGVFNTSASGSDSLPISIRANSQADYSRDMPGMSIPPISENILNQIILDMPATGEPRDRIATLEVALSQPVPTMTSNPLFPTTIIPSRTPSKTPVPTISKTRTPSPVFTPTKSFTPVKTSTHTSRPVFTLTKTFTPVKTSTRTPTPTPTETFTHTATPTFTPLKATSTATATPTPTPTSTEAGQTDTPTPTSTEAGQTDTPTPTATEGLPTETPTPTATPACMLISGGISPSGRNLEMSLTNNGDTPSAIAGILVSWLDTPESQALTEVRLNGATIINSNDPLPPSDYPSERPWGGESSDLELAALDSKLLVLLFSEDLQPGGYSITVTFDNGCVLNGSY